MSGPESEMPAPDTRIIEIFADGYLLTLSRQLIEEACKEFERDTGKHAYQATGQEISERIMQKLIASARKLQAGNA